MEYYHLKAYKSEKKRLETSKVVNVENGNFY